MTKLLFFSICLLLFIFLNKCVPLSTSAFCPQKKVKFDMPTVDYTCIHGGFFLYFFFFSLFRLRNVITLGSKVSYVLDWTCFNILISPYKSLQKGLPSFISYSLYHYYYYFIIIMITIPLILLLKQS